ncbi:MAG TPA: DUF4214 domain-containing protein [Pyrinomonadaceae bacterium]
MRSKRLQTSFLLILLVSLVLTITGVVASADGDVTVQTTLSGAAINSLTPKGVAEFRSNADGSRRFKAQAEDVNLPVGTALNVFVNGANVGAFAVNSLRQGELQLNTNDGQSVPNVGNGTTVVIKQQSGATVVSGTFSSVPPAPSPGATPSPSPGATPSPSPGATPSPSPGATPSPSPGDERYVARFSSASYTVAEDAGRVAITITRTGDTSREAKVDYATSNGTASDRSDYTVAFGRLRYAAGETSKTFNIPITDDVLVEGNETLHVFIVEASNSGTIGVPGSAVVFITDNDTASSASNPIEATTFFVRQHYLDFLNREPEPPGLSAWSSILEKCHNHGQLGSNDPSCDRVEVSSAFFRSPEFQERGFFIYRFYEAALGRRPRFAEFTPDMARLNGPQTPAEQEANKLAFIDEFMSRPEFRSRYDNLQTDGAFVDALLQTAGITLAQRDSLVHDLMEGSKTRAQVLREIVESPEVHTKTFNKAFVTMEYFGYLRRDPDENGYNHWLSYLEATGDYRTLVFGFVYSPENRQRFGEQ